MPVSHPAERDVTENIDFTGRTDAVEAVDIRARVTGYLLKTNFKEGSEVQAGDVLFEIDPRPYQAQLDQAMAQVDLNQSSSSSPGPPTNATAPSPSPCPAA